jgi:hypothetical protein
MSYEDTPLRNGVFLFEHALEHCDQIIVPLIGLLTRIVTQIIPLGLYTIC